jgi:hypothetical protein
MAQQLVVLGPLALFLFHSKDFSATYGQCYNVNALTGHLHWCGGVMV